MDKVLKNNKIFILILLILSIIVFGTSRLTAEKEDSISEIEDKLAHISNEEMEVLETLFIQVQEIEILEKEMAEITSDIDFMEKDIEDLEDRVDEESSNYEKQLDILKQVLNSYQRMGPTSYIEIILDADSLTNLLRRINTLRDLTKNTGELLDSIEELKEKLLSEKMNLDEKLKALEEKENTLKEALDKKQKLVKDMEDYLISLKGDRQYYLERLETLMAMLEEFKLLVYDITEEFSHIIEKGDFSEDEVKLKLTNEGVKGIIEEQTFNNIINANPNLPEIVLHFKPNKVEMELPENNVFLNGTFIIRDEQRLKFEVEEGSLYGMVLKKETLEDLFEDGYFMLNLEPLIGKNVLKSIEIRDGYIELTVDVKLF